MNASRAVTLLLVCALAACSGSNGSNGAPGLDTGTISGTVKDSSGVPVVGASIATTPTTSTTSSDSSGNFTLASIPIGAYTLTASDSGYQNGQVSAVGVAAGATTQVTVTLTAIAPTTGSISGTILGRQGTKGLAQPSVPVAGATVCQEVTTALVCTTSQPDGTFLLPGVSPGPVFVSAAATGWLAGETKTAVVVTAGSATTGVSITLSGSPTASATYVGATTCVNCHTLFDASNVSAWQHSAHATTVAHGLNQLDVTGWPAAPADCTAASIADSGVQATEPVSGKQQEVLLVRWAANCPGEPQFSMAFDANGNGKVDPGETVIPVQGTQGGIATDAGQCSQGGLLPLTAYNAQNVLTPVPCNANYLGSGPTPAQGYWQQEYLINIGPGAAKPGWVTWDTTGAPQDMLALPLAWNQRGQYWANAPDYNPTQQGTFAMVCAGCHDTGPALSVGASGTLTAYVAGSQNIACERCHGPGSDHAKSFDAKLIINPAYLTAQAQNEVCGQCHSNAVSSAQPAGVFDFAFNSQSTTGGGNFIPGVDQLANFSQLPSYGNPANYWPGGVFTSLDHMTFIDIIASAHNTNSVERVTCVDCHDSHTVTGGPPQFTRTDSQTGNQFAFSTNGAVLLDDVLCLACHATHGDFATVALEDAARYHVSQGGTVLMNGTAWTVSAADQATSTTVIADAVNAHMLAQAGMPAYFDPMGTINGQPVGRCSSCHMMKTGWTSNFLFSGPDATGKTADVSGDVSSHVFKVATAGDAALGVPGATVWSAIMPSACGDCHVEYRFGK